MECRLEGTIWFGICKPRLSAIRLRVGQYSRGRGETLSVWGWMPWGIRSTDGKTARERTIERLRKTYKSSFDSINLLGKGRKKREPSCIKGFNTIWFSQSRKSKDKPVEMTAKTMWGTFRLWDGRRRLSLWPNEHDDRLHRREPEDEAELYLDHMLAHPEDYDR